METSLVLLLLADLTVLTMLGVLLASLLNDAKRKGALIHEPALASARRYAMRERVVRQPQVLQGQPVGASGFGRF